MHFTRHSSCCKSFVVCFPLRLVASLSPGLVRIIANGVWLVIALKAVFAMTLNIAFRLLVVRFDRGP